jgi:hypothetical protein
MKKTMNRIFNIAIIFLTTAIFLTSCVKDTTNTTYTGSDLLEFANPNYIAPLNPIAKTITTTSITTPRADSMYIQLVGPQRSTATNVTFAVDAASTAVAGTDYTIVTPSPIVIPAFTSGVKVRVTVSKVTSTKRLIFNITGGDNAKISENFKTFTFTLSP